MAQGSRTAPATCQRGQGRYHARGLECRIADRPPMLGSLKFGSQGKYAEFT